MARTRQTFVNDKDGPIYISVEPIPECFELEPGERLTLVYSSRWRGDAVQIHFIDDRQLIVWPNARNDDIAFLVNGEPGADRSWVFKHK
jgi:hypothetical protein